MPSKPSCSAPGPAGDYRTDSDLDILIVKDEIPPEDWLEKLRDQARELQKSRLPEASGIDVICMTGAQFRSQRNLKNNLANSIAKQGANVVPDENLEYGLQDEEENIDWDDVETKLPNDAMGAARWLEAIAAAGILAAGDDKQIGRIAQNALKNAYKAALGAHGLEYPTSGRDGHNLRILTGLLRERAANAWGGGSSRGATSLSERVWRGSHIRPRAPAPGPGAHSRGNTEGGGQACEKW